MKIIIIGCGKVGSTLVEQLSAEGHDIVLVDTSEQKLAVAANTYDVLTLVGNGSSFNTQLEAGIEKADLLIAVTGSDEINLLCCLIAKKTGHCETIARVRNSLYSKEIGFIKEKLGISMIINPELTTAMEISKILRFPSAIKIDTFAKGRAELLKFKIKPKFGLDGLRVLILPNILNVMFLCVPLNGAMKFSFPMEILYLKTMIIYPSWLPSSTPPNFSVKSGFTVIRLKMP